MTVTEIKNAADYRKATNEDGVCVIDASATWCGPCQVISPHFERFSSEYTNIRFYKFDIDQVPDVAQELGVNAVPNFNFFKDGMIQEGIQGADIKKLEATIKQYA